MISEHGLREALHAAGDELAVPAGGAAALRSRARDELVTPAARVGRRRRRVVECAAAVVVLALLGSAIAVVADHRQRPAALPSHRSASPSIPGAGGAAGGAGDATSAPAISAGAPPAAAGSSRLAAPSPSGTASGLPAKVAASGQLTLAIARSTLDRDVDALRALAQREGGYVSATHLSEAPRSGHGSLSLAVPAVAFQRLVAGAERLGTVRALSTKADDVTGTYDDQAARLQALDAERSQLETLLGRTAKVSDLLAIENQIQQTESQIDELQANRRGLDQEISYSTLSVDLQVRAPAAAHPHPESGLSRAWSEAISGFTGGLRWLLSISGTLLFALLLAGALLLGGRAARRRLLPALRRHLL